MPNYQILLDSLNLCAQAAEASSDNILHANGTKQATSHTSNATPTDVVCISCKSERHPLYLCSKFRSLSHADKISLLKSSNYCLNCQRPRHFVKKCKSLNHCKHCQRPHHTLLHMDESGMKSTLNETPAPMRSTPTVTPANHTSIRCYWWCQVKV